MRSSLLFMNFVASRHVYLTFSHSLSHSAGLWQPPFACMHMRMHDRSFLLTLQQCKAVFAWFSDSLPVL